MAGKFQIIQGHKRGILFIIVCIVQVGLLLLFAYQTWEFVNILFPDDLLVMRLLTVFSVDGLAALWASLMWFYSFAHPSAKTVAKVGKWIDYTLSAAISITFMVMTYTFRYFHVTDLTWVQVGSVCSIAALILNVVLVFVFLDKEIGTRWPAEDEYEIVNEKKPAKVLDQGQHRQLPDGTNTGDYAVVASNGNGNGNGHTSKNGKSRQGN